MLHVKTILDWQSYSVLHNWPAVVVLARSLRRTCSLHPPTGHDGTILEPQSPAAEVPSADAAPPPPSPAATTSSEPQPEPEAEPEAEPEPGGTQEAEAAVVAKKALSVRAKRFAKLIGCTDPVVWL